MLPGYKNMLKVVIIGNSAAGFACLDTLVKNAKSQAITVISLESCPAYQADLLPEYLSGNRKEEELFLCPDDFYAQNNIQFFKGTKVIGINTRKQLVALKDNTKINYDYLVIASGQKVNIPDIPGTSKDGVLTAYTLEDFKQIKDKLLVADTVCISGEPKEAVSLSQIIANKNKQVKVIAAAKPEGLQESDNLEWIDSLSLAEIIGEGSELKAIKLTSGKAIGASLVIFAGNFLPCSEFLKETEVKTKDGYIIVDETGRTNLENIFACGSVSKVEAFWDKQKTYDEAANEGRLVAQNLIAILERGKTVCQPMS